MGLRFGRSGRHAADHTNISEFDVEVAKIDCDTARFRLLVQKRMSQSPSDPLDLDLHSFIRDNTGYHRIERIDEVHRSVRLLNYLCRWTEAEANEGNA